MERGPARWTRRRCVAEYERRTGRSASDEARLGWALAVRAEVHAHALRAFANVGRARPVAIEIERPAWVEEGLVALRSTFEAYRIVDPGWGLLVDRPTIVRDLGLLDGAPLPSEVAGNARVMDVVSKAKRELDVSHGARAKDGELRAFFSGVSMRRQAVTPAELNLLAIATGLEPAPTSLDPGRRRWADRVKRWELAREERAALAALSAVDLLLDEGPAVRERWRELLGVSDRLDPARGPDVP